MLQVAALTDCEISFGIEKANTPAKYAEVSGFKKKSSIANSAALNISWTNLKYSRYGWIFHFETFGIWKVASNVSILWNCNWQLDIAYKKKFLTIRTNILILILWQKWRRRFSHFGIISWNCKLLNLPNCTSCIIKFYSRGLCVVITLISRNFVTNEKLSLISTIFFVKSTL